MTLIIMIIIGGIVAGLLVGLIASLGHSSRRTGIERDYAAQARDRGLARVYEAQANQMNRETEQRREEAARIRRDAACDDAREPDHE